MTHLEEGSNYSLTGKVSWPYGNLVKFYRKIRRKNWFNIIENVTVEKWTKRLKELLIISRAHYFFFFSNLVKLCPTRKTSSKSEIDYQGKRSQMVAGKALDAADYCCAGCKFQLHGNCGMRLRVRFIDHPLILHLLLFTVGIFKCSYLIHLV